MSDIKTIKSENPWIKFDIEDIQNAFNEVISYSQDIEDVQSTNCLMKWFENKKDLIKAMGGNLIYTVPNKVTFDLDMTEKRARVNDFADEIRDVFNNRSLAKFILLNTDSFYDNEVKFSDDDKIPAGMRLLRAFKFFEKDKKILEEIQNRASMIIQENKIEGYLCFSVHPLDYLSSSENTYKWRSCHALDGEYRSGNLSYMMDRSTIICYLRGEKEDYILPHFPDTVPWNSKKWRMLLFFGEQRATMFAGRQYPFFNEQFLETIKEEVLNALNLSKLFWSKWHNDEIRTHRYKNDEEGLDIQFFQKSYLPIRGRIIDKGRIVKDEKHSLHFNDLLKSNYYTPYYCWDKSHYMQDTLLIGGEVPCLKCGESHIEIPDSVMCLPCELEYGSSDDDMFSICDCCGRRVLSEEVIYVDSTGETICDFCADTEYSYCDSCGELFAKGDIKYDTVNHDYRCYGCHSDRRKELEELANEFARSIF